MLWVLKLQLRTSGLVHRIALISRLHNIQDLATDNCGLKWSIDRY